MKFFNRRAAARKAHDERVARWEELMARYEATQKPIIVKTGHELTEEDAAKIRERFRDLYRNEGRRSPL